MSTESQKALDLAMGAFAEGFDKDKNAVKNLAKEGFPYAGDVLIKTAVVHTSETTGASCLKLRVYIKDRDTEYDIAPMFFRGKNGELTQDNKRKQEFIQNLLYIANPSRVEKSRPTIAMLPSREWDKEKKEFVENVPMPQMAELVGKVVKMLIVNQERFERLMINGYTRDLISYGDEDYKTQSESPEAVYIDNENKTFPNFVIWSIASSTTGQTLSEIIDGAEPVEFNEAVEKAKAKKQNGDFSPKPKADRKKDVMDQLKANLVKAGIEFDSKRFAMYDNKPIPCAKTDEDGKPNTASRPKANNAPF